ncbi:cellulose biosynthesis cyclic di-GMP-binding regulatory protein BcsB [Ancylobacter sp. IITR112]|uniref:cellulose biosynthesis cyclic di-GMP-binding regulatory protein BcsB n=1 Tax=Ancylobacter sp. IITR112 TaxID=3138073 RepID=UPI00352AB10D
MMALLYRLSRGILIAALLLAAFGAKAQSPEPVAAPAFDMQDGAEDAIATPAAMAPTAAPFSMTAPSPSSASPASPGAGAPGYAAPFQMLPGQPVATASATTNEPETRTPDRFIVPLQRLRLEGEAMGRGWVTYFTQQEVERPATLLIGYVNAIYVMPERSRLRVTINGQLVAEIPIASPQGPTQVMAAIPAGVLRAGGNLIRFDMQAVHRTDCSIDSTYDLWMEIDNALTGVDFDGGPIPSPATVEDLPAIGIDVRGTTHIRFIHNGPIEPHHSDRLLLAAQALSQRGRYSHTVVTIVGPDAAPAGPGTLNVVVGLPEDLRSALVVPPSLVGGQPLVRFVNDSRIGGTVLLLGGETGRAVEAAIERVTSGGGQIEDRNKLKISSRFAPDPPFFTGAGSVRFSEIGVMTQEFSGRRLQLRFPIGLPADFYGSANGQARILLDAAYAPSVRPGSQLSVYVNGSLASSYMLTDRHGGLMERKVIKIPLTHFRAGLNRIWIEVMLDVDSDRICGPGATLAHDKRFVVFDSSEFVMDDFARIGTSPNLAAFFGGGFPYLDSPPPVAVVMRHDAATVAAAATILARLAFAHEHLTPVDTTPAPASLSRRPVLFLGDINQMSPEVLRQVGVVDASKIRWRTEREDDPSTAAGALFRQEGLVPPSDALPMVDNSVRVRSGSGNEAIFDRWRDQVAEGSSISAELLHFQKWIASTFGLSLDFSGGGAADPFNPPPNTSILVAQGFAPNSDAVWTLIAGRTAESFEAAIDEFTVPEYWAKIYGQAVAFDAATGQMDIRVPANRRFIVTEPLTPSNLRLIAANWLSLNIVTYAVVLVLCCIGFAIVTSLLLRRTGRRA